MPNTYGSKTKSSLSVPLNPPPSQYGTSSPGKCVFNYQPQDSSRRGWRWGGGDVCLIYLVHCASFSHIHSLKRQENTSPISGGYSQRSAI